MRANEFENSKETFVEIFRKFLPLAMKVIGLKSLPEFIFEKDVDSPDQPTFGQFSNGKNTLQVNIVNRHPNDILRTIAHELTHYKQDYDDRLNDKSGETGSPEENEAHAVAGVVMRHFNKMYPEYLKSKPIIGESAGDRGDIPTGPQPQLIPFPKGTTMVDVSDVYDWYKLGMVISDLDDADPKIFGQGAPHTVIAFGSEEEENKLLPLLKKLGLSVHDIDRPEDVTQAIPAKMFANDLAETIRKVKGGYRLVAGSGRNLGTYPTHAGAERREKQVQYFKHVGENVVKENVGGNYLYHSTQDADTAKKILSSGVFLGSLNSTQPATDAQTSLPTVSFGRNLHYQLSGANVDRDYQVVFVIDRNALENRYKTMGTSHSQDTRGLAKGGDTEWLRKSKMFAKYFDTNANGKIDPEELDNPPPQRGMAAANIKKYLKKSKAGGEFEEVVPTKTGKIPWKGMLIGFYLVPGKEASKDPELLNHPLRLNMPRPNTFVKAQQGVAENFADGRNPQDKGDSARHGIKKGMSIAQLKKVRSSDSASPRKKQLAHWQINMRQGRKK